MKNLLQVALVAGFSYLAIDYLSKRKSKKAVAPAAAAPKDPSTMTEAELQETGEEGFATELAQEQQLGAAVKTEEQPLDWNSADGWGDTTPISYGM